jgi:hypothetical protein
MSAWGLGSPWGLGFPWGAPQTGEDYGCAIAQSGLLGQSQGGNMADWMCCFGEEIGSNYDTIMDIVNGYSLEYAVGVQLDVLGSILGLPRSGFGDDRYRDFLFIQRDLQLGVTVDGNWTGTGDNVLGICRQFIGPASGDPIVVHASFPYSFILTVPDVASVLEMRILAAFVGKSLYLGVLGQVIFIFGVGGVYCYEVAADTADACLYCYTELADTVGAGTYAGVVLIGDP